MIISNSEVDSFLACRKLHYYKYALGLYPKNLSRANHIGLLGHAILETYYRSQMIGLDKAEAFDLALDKIHDSFAHEDADIVSLVSNRFMRYCDYYAKDDFEIVDVEGVYKVPLSDQITFGMTLDLLVKYHSGPWAGQYVVIDHKYKYNFSSPDELSMHVQTYKYIWALRQLGFNVKRSVLNQIRYREDVKDIDKLFKRQELIPTDIELDNIMQEHLDVAKEIYNHKTQPVLWYATHSPRRANPRDCSGCYFRIPCRQERRGIDASRTLSTMYAPEDPHTFYKQYGY